MKKHSVVPDFWCLNVMVKLCRENRDSMLAKELFSEIEKMDFSSGQIGVFHCSLLIQALSNGGMMDDVMAVLKWMRKNKIKPNAVLYTNSLKSCKDLAMGKHIHAQIISSRTELDTQLQNTLLNMYSKCGSMDDARSVFDSMKLRNVVTWTTMMQGYGTTGNGKEALELFHQMQQEGVQPNQWTYTVVLSICTKLGDWTLGRKIHTQMNQANIKWNGEILGSLVNMYVKCGSMDDARSVFDSMKLRGIVTWNIMIQGYRQNGNEREVLALFHQLQQEGVQPDQATYVLTLSVCANLGDLKLGRKIHSQINQTNMEWNIEIIASLLNLYSKCGYLDDARSLFDIMRLRSVATWGIMIQGYREHGRGREALVLFDEMQQEGVEPDRRIYTMVLSVCADLGDLALGRKIYSHINRANIEWDNELTSSLLNMYVKCGSMDDARSVFDSMKFKDVVTWTTMLYGYKQSGNEREVLALLHQMQQEGVQPNRWTYSVALSMCTKRADLTLGRKIHSQINQANIEWDIEMIGTLLNMYVKCGGGDIVLDSCGNIGEDSVMFKILEIMKCSAETSTACTYSKLLSFLIVAGREYFE
jgi:pentatricopeptide repeat protein